jgi:hypothetical protein
MTRAHWSALGAGLIVATGIIGATAVAVLNVRSGSMAAAAALIFVLLLLVADVLGRRQRGGVARHPGEPCCSRARSSSLAESSLPSIRRRRR